MRVIWGALFVAFLLSKSYHVEAARLNTMILQRSADDGSITANLNKTLFTEATEEPCVFDGGECLVYENSESQLQANVGFIEGERDGINDDIDVGILDEAVEGEDEEVLEDKIEGASDGAVDGNDDATFECKLDGKFDGLIECCAVGVGVGISDTKGRMLGEVEDDGDGLIE